MMMKKIVLLITVFFVQLSFGQKKKMGDQFFEKGDYITAAQFYEEELQESYKKRTLMKIATCYYNVFEYQKAADYLKKLATGTFVEPDKTYQNQYNFMLYQMLAALDDYNTAFEYLKKYNDNLDIETNEFEYNESIQQFKRKVPDYEIKGVPFNSSESDFGAVKLNDTVYFTSDRNAGNLSKKGYKWTHRAFLDIYKVQTNQAVDSIGKVQTFSKNINSKLHEGNFCFSQTGDTIYFSRSNYTKGKVEFNADKSNNVHLFSSTKVKGEWSEPKKLPFNTRGYSYQHPALSPDGKRLYFSSDKEGGLGSFDLYYVTLEGGQFGTPINLGPTINTPNREHFPFVSKDNHLFFSSNGHVGLGMLDVFVSERVNDTLTKPINLGVPINSRYDDFNLNYYNEKQGFFSSNRNESNDDIYHFTQIGEIFLRQYTSAFEVRDKITNAYIPNSAIQLTDSKKVIVHVDTLGQEAAFKRELFPGVYIFKADCLGYQSDNISIRVNEKEDQKFIIYLDKKDVEPMNVEAGLEEVKEEAQVNKNKPKTQLIRDMLADPNDPPIVERNGKLMFILDPIYFDYDKWNIRRDSRIILDELAIKLERYPTIYIKISSHTDNRGSDAYNDLLSKRRAESTRNYLALVGYVNARRMEYEGYGERVLKVPCKEEECTETEHQLNRRSEFEIIKY